MKLNFKKSKQLPTYALAGVLIAHAGFGLSSCAKPQTFRATVKQGSASMETAAHSVFLAGRTASEEVAYSFLPDSAKQLMELKALPPQSVTLKQIDRQKSSENFIQGHQGETVKEDFTVSTLDKLDLVVVVDNSSSMGPYQQKLAAGLAPLLSHISNTDWQIMVTTTSALRKRNPADPTHPLKNYGCPRINTLDSTDKAVITRDDYLKNSQGVDAQFGWKVIVGESGDPVEHGLLAAVSAFDGECGDPTRSWTRPEAQKAVLILTDEENCGSDPDQDCDQEPDSDPQFFLDRTPAGTKLFALLHDTSRYAECPDDGYIRKPDDYRWLIAKTGGMEGNICEGRYEATLEEISRNMHPVPRKEYPLTYTPEPETVVLTVDGNPWTSAFSIGAGLIRLEAPLPPNSKVLRISYSHDPVPLSTKFPLSTTVDPVTLNVLINGVKVETSSYKVEEDHLVFAAPPPELAKINAEYRVASALPLYFPLARDALLETVKVTVDTVPITDFQIVGTIDKEIVLKEAPRDGVSITIDFETPDSRTVRYPGLPYGSERIVQVHAFDRSSQESIALEWKDSELIFQREDIVNSRQVEVIYALTPDSKDLALTLAQKPKEGTLSIVSSLANPCVINSTVEGTQLLFPCAPEELGELRIKYDYCSQIDNSFRLNGKFLDSAVWKVKVDGVETSNFTHEGSVVSFPSWTFEANTTIEVDVLQPVRY